MTKTQILQRISEIDDKLLEFYNEKPQNCSTVIINPMKLKKAELIELLDAFETLYELFVEMQA